MMRTPPFSCFSVSRPRQLRVMTILLLGLYVLKNFRLYEPETPEAQPSKPTNTTNTNTSTNTSTSTSTTAKVLLSSTARKNSTSQVSSETKKMDPSLFLTNATASSNMSASTVRSSFSASNGTSTTSGARPNTTSTSSNVSSSLSSLTSSATSILDHLSSSSSWSSSLFFDFSVTSNIQCRLQLEDYLFSAMTHWFQQDIPVVMNSYLYRNNFEINGTTTQNTTTSQQQPQQLYHHVHFFLGALHKNDYPKWEQEGTYACHYDYYKNRSKGDHPQAKEEEEEDLGAETPKQHPVVPNEAVVVVIPTRLYSRARDVMVLCPARPPSTQQQQQQQQEVPILTHVTIDRRKSAGHTEDGTLWYDVRPFLRCDELARLEPPPQPPTRRSRDTSTISSLSSSAQGSPQAEEEGGEEDAIAEEVEDEKPLFIAACTQLAGTENHYFLPQWIEYHKLLGVTHFWFYINEPWNGTSISKYRSRANKYNQDFVTFVPYDYRIWDHGSHVRRQLRFHCFFQQTANNECLYRGRQYGVDWMITTDVDEFVRIEKKRRQDEHTNQTMSLQEYFQQHKFETSDRVSSPNSSVTSSSSSSSTEKVATVVLNSIPYGRNRLVNHPSHKNIYNKSTYNKVDESLFLFEYVWREATPPESRPLNRVKNIVRPNQVGFVQTHETGNLTPGYSRDVGPANEIRLDHFKLAWRNIYNVRSHKTALADPYLRDAFGTQLREQLQQKWGISYRPTQPIPVPKPSQPFDVNVTS